MSLLSYVFFLMIRRPPRSTRTDTLFPYTTLFRSAAKPLDIGDERRRVGHCVIVEADDSAAWADLKPADPRRAAIELGRDQRQQVFGGIGQGAETVDHLGGEAFDLLAALKVVEATVERHADRKSTRLNSSHSCESC